MKNEQKRSHASPLAQNALFAIAIQRIGGGGKLAHALRGGYALRGLGPPKVVTLFSSICPFELVFGDLVCHPLGW